MREKFMAAEISWVGLPKKNPPEEGCAKRRGRTGGGAAATTPLRTEETPRANDDARMEAASPKGDNTSSESVSTKGLQYSR